VANPHTGQGRTGLTISPTEISEAIKWLFQNNMAITEENLAYHIKKRRQISILEKKTLLLVLKAALVERQKQMEAEEKLKRAAIQ
jgi:hypothetical protein